MLRRLQKKKEADVNAWNCDKLEEKLSCSLSVLKVKVDAVRKYIHTFLRLIVNSNCSYLNSQMKMRPVHNSANTKPIFTIPDAQSFGGMTPGHICKV
eukprot:scaffold26079_cov22-Cyclotella_meneghiniana.AAC.1